MNINVISQDDFQKILDKMEGIEQKLDNLNNIGIATNQLFSILEACKLLHVSKRTLQRYRDAGLLSFTQVSGKIMFQKTDIEAFLNANRVEAFTKKGGLHAAR
jgi:excisionase family DNA binding protein